MSTNPLKSHGPDRDPTDDCPPETGSATGSCPIEDVPGSVGRDGNRDGNLSVEYRLDIFRHDPSGGTRPHFQTYKLGVGRGVSLLEALLQIQEQQDPSLAFRYSCRGLVCGSCGLVVNGHLRLACGTQLDQLPSRHLVIEPLPGFEILKDLVVDMGPFWRKYADIKPWLHADATGSSAGARMTESQRDRVDQFSNCILCGLCCSACPVTAFREDFLGPAALAKLYRFLADSRETTSGRNLKMVNGANGAWGCRTATRCIDVCPKQVRPFDGIAGVRRKLVGHTLRSWLGRMPR